MALPVTRRPQNSVEDKHKPNQREDHGDNGGGVRLRINRIQAIARMDRIRTLLGNSLTARTDGRHIVRRIDRCDRRMTLPISDRPPETPGSEEFSACRLVFRSKAWYW